MKIQPVKPASLLSPKTTGYSATAALGLSVLSGVSKNKSFRKTHKIFAYVATALTALHIGLIEYYHRKLK